jgi:hypothetical protein
MSKKNVVDSDKLAVSESVPASLIVNDQLDKDKLLASLGLNTKEWDFEAEPPAHYWQPKEMTYVIGAVEGSFTYNNTAYGDYKVYVIRLTQPTIGYSNETKEAEMLQVGDYISVGERAAFRGLANKIGKEVVIICDGLMKTRANQNFWKIRVGIYNPAK